MFEKNEEILIEIFCKFNENLENCIFSSPDETRRPSSEILYPAVLLLLFKSTASIWYRYKFSILFSAYVLYFWVKLRGTNKFRPDYYFTWYSRLNS